MSKKRKPFLWPWLSGDFKVQLSKRFARVLYLLLQFVMLAGLYTGFKRVYETYEEPFKRYGWDPGQAAQLILEVSAWALLLIAGFVTASLLVRLLIESALATVSANDLRIDNHSQ